MSWLTLESGRAACAAAWKNNRRIQRGLGLGSACAHRQVAFSRHAQSDRGRSGAGNRATTPLHAKRRPRLSLARTFGEDFERRRIAAYSAGGAARLEFA